jgi:hypothetical protein
LRWNLPGCRVAAKSRDRRSAFGRCGEEATMATIFQVTGKTILDSRGNPTVEVEVTTE